MLLLAIVFVMVTVIVVEAVSVGQRLLSRVPPCGRLHRVKAVLGRAAGQEESMSGRFETHEVALQWAAALRPCLDAIAKRDADLARQLRRAVVSVPLNLAEGAERRGKDRAHLYRIAAGSAAEVRSGLRVAQAWGFVETVDLDAVEALADRLRAMLFRLTHARG